MFEQRQITQRRLSIKSDSTTVSSIEAEERVAAAGERTIQETSNTVQGHSETIQQIFINSSTGVKVGDEVHNHIHYNQLREGLCERSLNSQAWPVLSFYCRSKQFSVQLEQQNG